MTERKQDKTFRNHPKNFQKQSSQETNETKYLVKREPGKDQL